MGGLLDHRFRLSSLWLAAFLGVVGGLGLARIGQGPAALSLWLLTPLLLVTLRRQRWPAIILALLFGLALGWWRGDLYMNRLAAYEPLYYQNVTITVRALDDAVYGRNSQLTFDANQLSFPDGQRLTGDIRLSGFGANAVFRDDEVIATGKLYPGYGAYQSRMSFARLNVIAHHPSVISELRRRFIAGAQTALPEPLAPFVMGLLVGQRDTLPESVKDDLRTVGLTHIIAVSGANLTIILRASQRLLGKRSKRLSTFLTMALIGVFLLLAGACASIVRAAIVSVLSIAAAYYGRDFPPLNLIAMAAAVTAWANPLYLWSDLGWYLSFLAFFGVMVLGPLIQARWPGRWHDSLILAIGLESLCAELMTLPFVLHIFGQMSRVGLLANVLVVAAIPLAMLLGLIAGLAGMLAAAWAGWFAWPAVILLNYMLDTAHWLAGQPGVFVHGIGLSLWQMLGFYGLIGFLTAVLWFKNPNRNDIITDINQSKTKGLLA